MRRETKTWAGRLAAAAIVAAVLAYVPYHVYARSGLARTLVLKRELAALQAHNRDLSADNERLAREAEALRVDPAAIERVARNELGWVRAGEIVVDLSASTRGPSEGPLDPPRTGAAGQSLSSPTRSSIPSVPRP
jgi:cell division protein FtsB